jgi:hypothetical protein
VLRNATGIQMPETTAATAEMRPDHRAPIVAIAPDCGADLRSTSETQIAYRWQLVLLRFDQARRDNRLGFASVALDNGMVLQSLRVLLTRHGPRVVFPRRRVFTRAGEPACDTAGDPTLEKIIFFPSQDDWRAFSAAVVAQIERAYPGVLDCPWTPPAPVWQSDAPPPPPAASDAPGVPQ